MIRRCEPASCKSPTPGRGSRVPASRTGTVPMTPEGRKRALRAPYLRDSDPRD